MPTDDDGPIPFDSRYYERCTDPDCHVQAFRLNGGPTHHFHFTGSPTHPATEPDDA